LGDQIFQVTLQFEEGLYLPVAVGTLVELLRLVILDAINRFLAEGTRDVAVLVPGLLL
jgi:hypothetical protein